MVLKAAFNNIAIISWMSLLLVEENRVPRENYLPEASHWQTLSHNVAWITPRQGIRTNNLSVDSQL